MRYIMVNRYCSRFLLSLAFVMWISASPSLGQRISILPQSESELSFQFSQILAEQLNELKIRVDDFDLSQAAADSVKIDNKFNMTTSDAKRLGVTLGNPLYVLVKAENQRRTSSAIDVYFEASAAIYLISSSSGQLVKWHLISIKESTPNKASQGLMAAAKQAAHTIAGISVETRSDTKQRTTFPAVPDHGTPGFEGLRPPMPFRRITPAYTSSANLYGIEATIEIEANIDIDGTIAKTEVVRWAGYGLDESVEETVRRMNWRPATIGNRTLPMRVLLRYNFKKIEQDEEN